MRDLAGLDLAKFLKGLARMRGINSPFRRPARPFSSTAQM